MTDNEIIKALECEALPSELNCIHGEYMEAVGIYCHKKKQCAENCHDCEGHRMAYYGKRAKATLDLINRQKAENEELISKLDELESEYTFYKISAQEQIEGLIAGQETLQKALNEKIAEVEALNGNLYTVSSACKQRRDEAVKEFAEDIINNILPKFMTYGHEEIALRISFAISRKAKEMVGETE